MDHSEAIERMATERYLLNELPPEAREAFEDHVFDCPECAFDLRAGATFVSEAKVQLPELTRFPDTTLSPEWQKMPDVATAAGPRPEEAKPEVVKKAWVWRWPSFLTSPAFAAPVFATLLLVVGYQNLVTYPALRMAAAEPQILPWTSLHAATRGAVHVPVEADRKHGAMLLVDLPQRAEYSSYAFELSGTDGKVSWSHDVPASEAAGHDGTLSLLVSGAAMSKGAYTLTVFGISAGGERTQIQRHNLDFQVGMATR